MNFKEAVTILILKIILPTVDVVTDWYFGIQLITGHNFDIQCNDYVAKNHVRMGIVVLVPPIISALLHIKQWYHFEKKENGGQGRMLTFPFAILQIWPQYRWIQLIIVLTYILFLSLYWVHLALHFFEITKCSKILTVFSLFWHFSKKMPNFKKCKFRKYSAHWI